MRMAGLKPYGVLCELTNPDGTMARIPEILEFSGKHDIPVVSVEDIKICPGGSASATI